MRSASALRGLYPDDDPINSIKNLERVNPNSENFMQNPPPMDYFTDSPLICDDAEANI